MNPSKVMFVFWLVLLIVGIAYFITVGALHR
jgi:hypothetical protein